MTTTALSSTSQLGNSSLASTPLPTQTLGEKDFLQLMVTQMTNQDPLNPQSDTDFVAQLAQFSNLQATQGMQSNVAFLQASSLLGSNVQILDAGKLITGPVAGVQMVNGAPNILVNGQAYGLGELVSATPPAPATTTTPTSTN